MAQASYQIAFDGKATDDDFYSDVISLTIEENTETAGVIQLRLMLTLQDDGSWNYLDDPRLTLFKKVQVMVGFSGGGGLAAAVGSLIGGGGSGDGLVVVFEGYITSVVMAVGSAPPDSYLDILALDTSVLMSLEEKVVAWPNLADSDIVTQILGGYHVTPQVDATAPTHHDNDTTIVQRGTDLQFVRMLARKNGMEFYFQSDPNNGATAYFQAPQLGATPQPDLAIQFGDQSNLFRFQVRLNGQRPLHVKVQQVDVKSQSINLAQAGNTQLAEIGKDDLNALIGSTLNSLVTPRDAAAQMLVAGIPTSNLTELQAIAQAVRDESAWMITAEGEVDTDTYQAVLRPHRLVLVKGVGACYSGKYYVTRVIHELQSDGQYSQKFEARRNARGVDGSESFGGTGVGVSLPGV
jgi:phage protein D